MSKYNRYNSKSTKSSKSPKSTKSTKSSKSPKSPKSTKSSKSPKSPKSTKSTKIKILRTIPHISDSLSQAKYHQISQKFDDLLFELDDEIAECIFGFQNEYLKIKDETSPASNKSHSPLECPIDDPFAMNVSEWEDISIIRVIDALLPFYHKKYKYLYFPKKTVKTWHVLKRELYLMIKDFLGHIEIGGIYEENLLNYQEIYDLLLCLKMRIEEFEIEDEQFGYIYYLDELFETKEKFLTNFEKVKKILMEDDDYNEDKIDYTKIIEDVYEGISEEFQNNVGINEVFQNNGGKNELLQNNVRINELSQNNVGINELSQNNSVSINSFPSACIPHYSDTKIDSYFSKISTPTVEDHFLYTLSYIIKESLETFTDEFPRIRGFRKNEIGENSLKLMEIAKSNLNMLYSMSRKDQDKSRSGSKSGGSKSGENVEFEPLTFENVMARSIFPEEEDIKEVFPNIADCYLESLHQILELTVDLFLTTCSRCPHHCVSHYKESY